mmetsp:Transcript_2278/g.2606  ORF Transcript_2278/g.2606 Transcript_2278/m.2606 type:complete len:218 (-) Transcript_2278:144-797(-)
MDIRSSKTNTVLFDVGGKIYKVSRSLLEQHSDTMLARLASDTWCATNNTSSKNDKQDDNTTALFIERDGERFRCVLDYMRDGGIVHLPSNIQKEAVIQDLTYYGFRDVDPSKISVSWSLPLFEVCNQEIISCLKNIEDEREIARLAHHCISAYQKNHFLSFHFFENADKEYFEVASELSRSESSQNFFSAILKRIGLELCQCAFQRGLLYHLQLKKL